MKKFLAIMIIQLFLLKANSQTVDWVNYGGGSGADVASELVKDASHNYYITGQIANAAQFNNTSLTGGVFVAKYDSNGVQQWVVAQGDTHTAGKSICLDQEGNIYVAGWMDATTQFGDTLLTNLGDFDIILAKYNPIGDLIWVRQFGGSRPDKVIKIICDQHDHIFLTGYFSSTAQFGNTSVVASSDSTEIFFAKSDTAGNIQWVKQAGGMQSDQGNSICTDASGNIFITGTFQATATFDSNSVTSSGQDDFFIAKYDSSGNALWIKTAGSYDSDKGLGVCIDSAGNCYITGNFRHTVSFGGFTITSWYNSKDLFVVSYSPSGICRWAKQASGSSLDRGADIDLNEEAKIVVGGSFSTWVNFSGMYLNTAGDGDLFVARYDTLGNVEAILKAGGTNEDRCFAIVGTKGNKVVAAGYFTNSATFGNYTLTSHGTNDAMIVKMSLGSITITSLSDSSLCPGESFDVNFIADGTFLPGNTFIAQLSNSTGDFSFPTYIGSWSSIYSGTVHCVTPNYFTAGSGYRIRIISNSTTSIGWYPIDVSLNNNPVVTINGNSSVCLGDTIMLIASGASVYSWIPAASLSSAINDSVLAFPTFTTNYQVVGTNQNGCLSSSSKTVTVELTIPEISISAIGVTTICANQTVHLTTGYVNGEAYQWQLNGSSIPGAIYTNYYASESGTYVCVATNSCGFNTSNSINVTVHPVPVVTIGSFLPVCQLSTAFALGGGTPVGGTYSGSYVNNGIFTPSTVGNWNITYSYTDSNGCSGSASSTIQVVALPTVTFIFSPTAFCETNAPVTLTGGAPSGGTYYGTGVSNGTFDPAAAGPGTFTISYTYTNINGCSKTATKIFTVSEMPSVSLTMDTMVCNNVSAFALTGGLPSGGTYYVDGSMSSIFDPGLLGAGYHDVVYKKVNGSCIGYDTVSVVVTVCTGLEETSFSSIIEIYPNPASDQVTIETSLPNSTLIVEFYNAVGVCVKKIRCDNKEDSSRISIDVHALSRGIYWIIARNDSQRYFKKLVLE